MKAKREHTSGNEPELLQLLQRHLVPIRFDFDKDGEKALQLYTAFVLEVHGDWYLVTAGHCLIEVARIIDSGYKVTKCQLVDFLGPQAQFEHGIPFPTPKTDEEISIDEGGIDFGALPVPYIIRQSLEKNGVVALSEEHWKELPEKIDFYRLVGIPKNRVRFEEKEFTIGTRLIGVVPAQESEHYHFQDVTVPIVYVTATIGDDKQLKGMSGGPIFGIQQTDSGYKYWLFAVQSLWYEPERLIGAPPASYLCNAIEQAIVELSRQESS